MLNWTSWQVTVIRNTDGTYKVWVEEGGSVGKSVFLNGRQYSSCSLLFEELLTYLDASIFTFLATTDEERQEMSTHLT